MLLKLRRSFLFVATSTKITCSVGASLTQEGVPTARIHYYRIYYKEVALTELVVGSIKTLSITQPSIIKPTINTVATHLPGLNGLRAMAAFIVMVFHTDQFSHYFGMEPYGFYKTKMQSYAVLLFFVLSGFLITWLLLKEKQQQGKIKLGNFYMRRILRTWPLYYTVLIIGVALLVLLPGQIYSGLKHNLFITTLAYGILIPNIASFFGYAPDVINVLWSVGAEEQFYFFWPLLVNDATKLLDRIIGFLFVYLAVKYLLIWLQIPFKAQHLMSYMPFDCMAIGSIAACLYYSSSKALQTIYHPVTQVLAWAFLLVSVFYRPIHIPFTGMLNTDIHAIVYAIIILNVGTNTKTLVNLENKVLNFLGKISYGIYGYHFIVLFLLSLWLKNKFIYLSSPAAHAIMFGAVIVTTICVAWLSNRYLEAWFIKRKVKFSASYSVVLQHD